MTLFATTDGQTPLTPQEQADLIPDLSTRQELNEWERQNILQAYAWALNARTLLRRNPLTEPYLRDLHTRMFDETWKWAGRYRVTERNIGIPHFQIRDSIAVLLGNVDYWVGNATYEPDEIAIRLHHELVSIHPFPNGNGRHARLLADVVARRHGRPVFSWGSGSIVDTGQLRRAYIDALRTADRGDIQPLLVFARW